MAEERVDIRHIGCGFDQVFQPRPRGRQANPQIFAHLFDLRRHVAWADDLARRVARELAGDIDPRERTLAHRDDMAVEHAAGKRALIQASGLNILPNHAHGFPIRF